MDYSQIKEAITHSTNTVALNQLLTMLQTDAEITRKVKEYSL